MLNLLSAKSYLVPYLLVLLSPIVVIAIAHNLLYIVLDLFIRDLQTSEIPQRKSWFPG